MKHFSFGPGPAGVIGGHSHGEGPFTTGCPFCGQLRGRKEGRVVREKTGTSYTTRYCGTTSAGRLRTDSAWNLSLRDRKSTRLNSSHVSISYAVFCLKKKMT